MLRVLALAAFMGLALLPQDDGRGVLRIVAVLPDADGKPAPVPRHALLISDNPSTSAPRRVVTGLDGTAEVRLRPGSYTVESDRPATLNGKSYEWREVISIAAGRDAVVELTAAKASVGDATNPTNAPDAAGAPPESDPAFLLSRWQHSVVEVWTPTTHGSGFIVDAAGLVVTSQRVIGGSQSAEVQVTPQLKVSGAVATDVGRDVVVVRVAPQAIAGLTPIPLPCDEGSAPTIADGEELFALRAPMRQPKGMTSGTARRDGSAGLAVNFDLDDRSAGGPVFSTRGVLAGIAAQPADDRLSRGEPRVIGIDQACSSVAQARARAHATAPPPATLLPIESARPFPVDALRQAAEKRAGTLNPYQVTSSGFDVAFITPVLIYGAEYQAEQMRRRTTSKDTRTASPEPLVMRPLMDFADWSDYFRDFPPVLLIRATPKMAEGFWTTVARAAARTQGVALPPMKRYKSGFLNMRVFCGDVEVTPVHPFTIERQVSEKDSVFEGLYVFDPAAIGPHCGTVKLTLFSEKESDKPDTRVVDPKIVQQVWEDFRGYRGE